MSRVRYVLAVVGPVRGFFPSFDDLFDNGQGIVFVFKKNGGIKEVVKYPNNKRKPRKDGYPQRQVC